MRDLLEPVLTAAAILGTTAVLLAVGRPKAPPWWRDGGPDEPPCPCGGGHGRHEHSETILLRRVTVIDR